MTAPIPWNDSWSSFVAASIHFALFVPVDCLTSALVTILAPCSTSPSVPLMMSRSSSGSPVTTEYPGDVSELAWADSRRTEGSATVTRLAVSWVRFLARRSRWVNLFLTLRGLVVSVAGELAICFLFGLGGGDTCGAGLC